MTDSKKGHFSKSPILNIFLWQFHGSVLGLVEFIDAKGIGMSQPIWPWGCPTYDQKWPKNTKNAFLACFWAHVGQPHGHIDWAIPMPFESMISTNPRTNPWSFHKQILRIGDLLLSRPFWILFFQKKIFLCFIPMKISHKLCVRFWFFPSYLITTVPNNLSHQNHLSYLLVLFMVRNFYFLLNCSMDMDRPHIYGHCCLHLWLW